MSARARAAPKATKWRRVGRLRGRMVVVTQLVARVPSMTTPAQAEMRRTAGRLKREPVLVSSDLSEREIGAEENSGGKLFPVVETKPTTADGQHEETATTVKVYSDSILLTIRETGQMPPMCKNMLLPMPVS